MIIILGRSKSLGSLAIRLFTWSRWSHCGIVFDNVVYESSADLGGVVVGSLDYFKKRYPKHLIIEIPSAPGQEQRAISQLSKKYDWGGIFKFVFRGNWSESDKWTCSEYAAYVSGIFNPKYNDRITPQHLLMIAKQDD